ncbi:MAG TPA: response regulator transcription factor [Geminicoccus sp.]|jgi:DNA-binding response OmpR family regulator|uniref:response regulator transcription factor n=1 Tax=Geminicoccus sp. TaxID=2024832 RepID=UPI002E380A9A|nr:response regulator transcription factor [Geminicoccus sp.]HEX2527110.1 response regulator transcription factor [Geminicoccus sp.]
MRILLIEDHPTLRDVTAGHLASRGFVVDAFANARDALAAVAVASYDAVILDLGLPDMDGMDLLAEIRARTRRRLPALIASARDALPDRIRGLDAGADDYLVKPFDLLELEARLRAVLRRPGERAEDLLRSGGLEIDTVARTAAVDGRPLDLHRREFSLLEQLLRAGGRLVVRDALEERIYGLDEPVTPNALEALVSRLRRKLENSGSTARIETRRGIGYRLVAEERA